MLQALNFTVIIAFILIIHPATGLAGEEKIFVTLPPQAWLVEKITGQTVQVYSLVNKGQDPHTFEPKPRQVVALTQASLYFTIGLPFEKRLVEKALANNRRLKIAEASAGIARLPMTDDHHGHQSANPEGGSRRRSHHQEGEPDPHIWLAPANLRMMAKNITSCLRELFPDRRELFRKNHAALDAELASLDKRLGIELAPWRGRTFYVFHPAFGYFAKAYGLKQEAVETGGKSPSPKQLAILIRKAREDGVKTIFVQPQFDPRAAQVVARGIGGRVMPIDPLAREVITGLEAMSSAISTSFSATGQSGGRQIP